MSETMLMQGSAVFSDCHSFRHRLDRWWGPGPRAVFLMANPSYAGAEKNDPTVFRCYHFTRAWGFDGLTVLNWEPYIATNPDDLHSWRAAFSWNQPIEYREINKANLALIREVSETAGIRVVAWGNLVPQVLLTTKSLLALSLDRQKPLYCLGMNKDGSPKHPLARGRNRVPNDQQPVEWLKPVPPSRSPSGDRHP